MPIALLHSLEDVKGFDRKAFEKVHEYEEQVISIRMNSDKESNLECLSAVANLKFEVQSSVPWCPHGKYLSDRPSFTLDPLLHSGVYYVQEASSMFLWYTLEKIVGKNIAGLKVLDLCASPGGKSTLLASYFKEGLIVSNEVIKSRAAVLVENITKWGSDNVVVANNDPKDFAALPEYFDIIIVDAPCSGSGLFRKDPDTIKQWSEENVLFCGQRQQRILADIYPSLKKEGILIYSTCSYSSEEDEKIVDWMKGEFAVDSVRLTIPQNWNVIEVETQKHKAYSYRFFPDKVKGEGFFIAALKKNKGENFFFHQTRLVSASKEEIAVVQNWLKKDADLFYFTQNENVIVIPSRWKYDLALLQKNLYLRKAGVTIGALKRKDFTPHHELALSLLVNEQVSRINANYTEAIQYLKKKELLLENEMRGWAIVNYCEVALGWIKVLHNRINNYYPTNWRILKD